MNVLKSVPGIIAAIAVLCVSCKSASQAASTSPLPNIVLIFCDDLGYADIGPFGSKTPTPNLDRFAREGTRFTDLYVGQAVCSASRAAILTGCYPNRVGILGALGPRSKVGLSTNEVTIARLLKGQGYATAMFGKWHLGDAPKFLPTRHGFDQWFGLPYSNDMWPHHPTGGATYPPLPLYENERVIQVMPDQTQLTTWYTERAVNFIERNRSQPFFLYLPHSMPHVPLFVSSKFRGKSGQGIFGDVIMEIDWSVGQILDALKRTGLDENTLVVFTSDNGPWLSYGDHAGSAGPLREGKGTSFDGGVRTPCLMRWPGKVPPGRVCREPVTTMDMMPTVARITGATAPLDRIIDGRDISPLMFGTAGARSPHEAIFIYWRQELQAVRSGQWKLHFPHDYLHIDVPGAGGKPGIVGERHIGRALFDLEADPGETNDVSKDNPQIVARLQDLAQRCRADLGDSRTKTKGQGSRPPGRL